MDIEYQEVGSKTNVYISKVEIRVTHNDSTFGYESIGSGNQNIVNNIIAAKGTSGAEAGTGDYIKAAVKYKTNPRDSKAHLFNNDAGGTMVTNGSTGEVSIDQTTYDWEQYDFSTGPTIVASTVYQIGVWAKDVIGSGYMAREDTYPNLDIWNSLTRTYNGWANLGDVASEDHYEMSIYCTYTPSGEEEEEEEMTTDVIPFGW